MACGLAFIPAQRSDAQVSVGIGVGYPSYGYRYYPMDTAMVITHTDTTGLIGTTAITTGARTTMGHRYYRHHRNHPLLPLLS